MHTEAALRGRRPSRLLDEGSMTFRLRLSVFQVARPCFEQKQPTASVFVSQPLISVPALGDPPTWLAFLVQTS